MSIRGELVSFDGGKGYGWIRAEDGPDVFVHVNDIDCDKRDLRPGVVVEYDEEAGPKGPRAVDVRPVDDQPSSGGHSSGGQSSSASAPAAVVTERRESADSDLVDILTPDELRRELTERLLAVDPPLLSTQVLAVRGAVDAMSRRYGWIAD